MRVRPLLLAASLVLGAAAVHAQSMPDWAEPSGAPAPAPQTTMAPPTLPGGGGAPTQVPLDGGLSLLALAGGAYAVRRLRSR